MNALGVLAVMSLLTPGPGPASPFSIHEDVDEGNATTTVTAPTVATVASAASVATESAALSSASPLVLRVTEPSTDPVSEANKSPLSFTASPELGPIQEETGHLSHAGRHAHHALLQRDHSPVIASSPSSDPEDIDDGIYTSPGSLTAMAGASALRSRRPLLSPVRTAGLSAYASTPIKFEGDSEHSTESAGGIDEAVVTGLRGHYTMSAEAPYNQHISLVAHHLGHDEGATTDDGAGHEEHGVFATSVPFHGEHHVYPTIGAIPYESAKPMEHHVHHSTLHESTAHVHHSNLHESTPHVHHSTLHESTPHVHHPTLHESTPHVHHSNLHESTPHVHHSTLHESTGPHVHHTSLHETTHKPKDLHSKKNWSKHWKTALRMLAGLAPIALLLAALPPNVLIVNPTQPSLPLNNIRGRTSDKEAETMGDLASCQRVCDQLRTALSAVRFGGRESWPGFTDLVEASRSPTCAESLCTPETGTSASSAITSTVPTRPATLKPDAPTKAEPIPTVDTVTNTEAGEAVGPEGKKRPLKKYVKGVKRRKNPNAAV